jgi:hypothetical protein
MRFAVEAWDPDYGSPLGAELDDGPAPVDVEVEVAADAWAPIHPTGGAPRPPLCFVDGVRRVEAHVWISAPPGGDGPTVHQGICASYAAGVVRCDGRAVIESTRTERALFCDPQGADGIRTRHGEFALVPVPGDDPGRLTIALQAAMGRLEVDVANGGAAAGPVIVDGPLKDGQHRAGFVGYVKTHRRRYGPPLVAGVVAALDAGERTPILCIGDPRRPRFSWYLRLPGGRAHDWAGVVRLEVAAEVPIAEAVRVADCLAEALPPYASTPQKDSRAPQNLFPIAGLERELRHRLGDAHLMLRALRQAAGVPVA